MEFETFHEAYSATLRRVLYQPAYHNAPRGFSSVERIGEHYQIANPVQRIPMVPARRLNIVFNFAESLWYLSGRDDLDFISYYAPSMRKYSADGTRLTGTAYGRAIFGDGRHTDQWHRVVDELRSDPDSKRAVVQIFDSHELSILENPDVSCTLGLQFLIRDDALHAIGFMRANDAYRGMTSDIFSFTFLQEMLARELGVTVGTYHHSVGSLHVYEPDQERAREVLDDPASTASPIWEFPSMPDGDNWPYVRQVLAYEEELRTNRYQLTSEPSTLGLPDYWMQLVVLFEVFRRVRHDLRLDADLLDPLTPLYRWLLSHWQPHAMVGLVEQARGGGRR
jgi:thymidylate synthase